MMTMGVLMIVARNKRRVLSVQTIFAVLSCLCTILLLLPVRSSIITKPIKRKPFSQIHIHLPILIGNKSFVEPSKKQYERIDDLKVTVFDSEAIVSLQTALQINLQGKENKALKLFQHSVILLPKLSDNLIYLGEFVEETNRDIVVSDKLYPRATSIFLDHAGAQSNRRPTSSIYCEIDEKMNALTVIPDSNSGLKTAIREVYFQHIYHMIGVQNTMTFQHTRSILDSRLVVFGKSIYNDHNEILGLDTAMKYINSTLLNRSQNVTIEDILKIHRRVMGYINPLKGGHFRRIHAYVGYYIPPGPMFINILMEQFLKWLNSKDALDMHPVRYAALAHYKLVHIHPFIDGNGRTSRLLMNVLLMKAGYPPIIILKQHRHLYYQHLQTANEGDVRPFLRFIAECTERTLDLYLWLTNEFSHQIPVLAHPTILGDSGREDDEGLS